MRHKEITPELIELSKKAKEPGFPQDVEEGDWIGYDLGGETHTRTVYDAKHAQHINQEKRKRHWFLILEFSRCLEWLGGRIRTWDIGTDEKLNEDSSEFETTGDIEFSCRYIRYVDKSKKGDKKQPVLDSMDSYAKTYHEAIAKAVVKILEEE